MSKPPREENAPSWLNDSFMETALKKSFKNEDLKILESEMKLATAAAEHYGSQLFRYSLTLRINKDGTTEKLSVLVKLVTPGKLGEGMEKFQGYDKEENAFTVVLPAINRLLEKAYPDHKKLWAECYYHQKVPNYILILEDLRVRGYVLASRFEGLNMEHSSLVLKSLAKLHAASLALKKQNPEKLEMHLENGWKSENAECMRGMFSIPFKIMSEDILEWEECERREIYSKKLKHVEKTTLDKIFEFWKIDENKLNVLLHGDAWINNFMFKYDPNGKLSGINFVDFQLMTVNNPALDLQYFIFTSVSPDIRFDYIDLFLQIYYEAFEDTLKRLGHQLERPYSLEQLKKDFEEKYFWGFAVFCVIFPVFLVPSSEAFHPDTFVDAEGLMTDFNFLHAKLSFIIFIVFLQKFLVAYSVVVIIFFPTENIQFIQNVICSNLINHS